MASLWVFITAGYCGIEQTLKYLIALTKGLTIQQLLKLKEGAGEGKSRPRSDYRTHN